MRVRFKSATWIPGKLLGSVKVHLENLDNGKTIELEMVPLEFARMKDALNEAQDQMFGGKPT